MVHSLKLISIMSMKSSQVCFGFVVNVIKMRVTANKSTLLPYNRLSSSYIVSHNYTAKAIIYQRTEKGNAALESLNSMKRTSE